MPSATLHQAGEEVAITEAAVTSDRFFYCTQPTLREQFFVLYTECAVRFAEEFEIALFHAAGFAVVHPLATLCRIAPIEPIFRGESRDTADDSRWQIGHTIEDHRDVLHLPHVVGEVVIAKVNLLMPFRQDEAEDTGRGCAFPVHR